MIDPQKNIIRRSDVASKFVLLEAQISHVGADALGHQGENLLGSEALFTSMRSAAGIRTSDGNAWVRAQK